MNKLLVISAIAVLAACGGSDNKPALDPSTTNTSSTPATDTAAPASTDSMESPAPATTDTAAPASTDSPASGSN